MACPLCQKTETRVFRTGIREDAAWPVYACGYCGLHFIEPRFKDIRDYYRSEYRKVHELTPGKVLSAEERGRLQYEFYGQSAKLFMEEVPEGASVLEIGCSAGGFLAHLQGKYDLYGLEWNPEDAEYVRTVGEVPCDEGELETAFPGKQFTAIVALQVLEHQLDPMAFIRQCRERLIGGGWLYLELPNLSEALLSMYGVKAYEDFFYREPHITYWKAETIAALMNVSGFEARIDWEQRYSFQNHVNWLLNGVPMSDPRAARHTMLPVPKGNPGAPALNRIWDQLAAEYRVQMKTLFVGDTLVVKARRRAI